MDSRIRQTEALTREVRACFNRLKALGDALHRDIGISAAMRAVLEALDRGGEQTVPQIARSKRVTRQHIQVLVNALLGKQLVTTRANPADRRSPLVCLTGTGRDTFTAMRQREKRVLDALTRAMADVDLDAAIDALSTLRAHLEVQLDQGDSND